MSFVRNRSFVLAATVMGMVLALFLWAYWTTLGGLAEKWSTDPNYSQGFLIPGLALIVFCHRLRGFDWQSLKPDGRGLLVLIGATGLRLLGAYYHVTPLDHLSLLLMLAGFLLTFGGWPLLARALPALVLLIFMIPIPRTLGGSQMINGLQKVATVSSSFLLETCGFPAQREGNLIIMSQGELEVIEACSGLRMSMVFGAFALATALLVSRSLPQRIILILSAVPLAIGCNIVRITTTGIVSETLGSDMAHKMFHDISGWLMVPLAFCLLGLELFLLRRLLVPVSD
jgi:exosortase